MLQYIRMARRRFVMGCCCSWHRARARVGRGRPPLHHAPRDRSAAGRAQGVLRPASRRTRSCGSTILIPGARPAGRRRQSLPGPRPRRNWVRFRSPRCRGIRRGGSEIRCASVKRHGILPWRRRGVRQSPAGLRGVRPEGPVCRGRRRPVCRRVRRTICRTRSSRCTTTNNYDGQFSGQSGVHAGSKRRSSSASRRRSRSTRRPSRRSRRVTGRSRSFALRPSAGPADAEGRQGGRRRPGAVRRRVLPPVLRACQARPGAAARPGHPATAALITGGGQQAGRPRAAGIGQLLRSRGGESCPRCPRAALEVRLDAAVARRGRRA